MAVDKVTIKSEQNAFTVDTKIRDVITDAVFGDYMRLLFPADRGYYSGDELDDIELLKSARLFHKDYQSGKQGFTLAAVLLFETMTLF